ncbi:DNA-packaging protein [Aquamicrobium sp.]|uniref:DNA-packaging protein n=1 Tax=Aquamicrobium sp. TaxID=1872579 RepID=UPI00258C772A|nr:DNA-packaging protein [Aquamicrobium sp.]MCK9549209.1 DNA-packaging protein [Aquamicrobium sp.]
MARAVRKGRPRKADIKAAADRAERRAKGEKPAPPKDHVLDPPETAKRDEKTGRFLPGNRFWMARSSAGPNPKFAKADDLWSACVEYFDWVQANPLYADHIVTFQGMATHEPVAKMRAMTIAGLCLFLDISQETWRLWKRDRSDLLAVITRAETVIYSQKFAGAAADLLNANIIARDLGLADKNELTGKDGEPLMPESSSPRDIARAIFDILRTAQINGDQK